MIGGCTANVTLTKDAWKMNDDLVSNILLSGWEDLKATEGTWVWTDGYPVTYSDWWGSRPNDGTKYNCLVTNSSWNWQWMDYPCSYSFAAVCKIPA